MPATSRSCGDFYVTGHGDGMGNTTHWVYGIPWTAIEDEDGEPFASIGAESVYGFEPCMVIGPGDFTIDLVLTADTDPLIVQPVGGVYISFHSAGDAGLPVTDRTQSESYVGSTLTSTTSFSSAGNVQLLWTFAIEPHWNSGPGDAEFWSGPGLYYAPSVTGDAYVTRHNT